MKIPYAELQLGPMIGNGTVGAVHRATLLPTGQTVAVKLLHPAVSQDPLVRARFRREMEILERLHHPNIIRYFGGGEHDGQLYYVMEAVECGTVKDLLERFGSLSWAEVASIARQVGSALQHSHNQGVIHRDLKPGNLFLTAEGQIKLGDFGIARDTHSADLTSEGLTVGTHAYMSPEQITGETQITGKADLYSLGCVLFELLTGNKPFPGNNFAAIFEQHLRKPAPRVTEFVPQCPKLLDDMIAALLEKQPERRPFNARAVQAVALRLLDESPQPCDAATTTPLSSDVPAANVRDVSQFVVNDTELGMLSLASKLNLSSQREVSWKMLSVLALAVVVLIAVAAITSR
ncbi:MAG: serine/threonine-protein kinase [Pirellulaceae bacterium]